MLKAAKLAILLGKVLPFDMRGRRILLSHLFIASPRASGSWSLVACLASAGCLPFTTVPFLAYLPGPDLTPRWRLWI